MEKLKIYYTEEIPITDINPETGTAKIEDEVFVRVYKQEENLKLIKEFTYPIFYNLDEENILKECDLNKDEVEFIQFLL